MIDVIEAARMALVVFIGSCPLGFSMFLVWIQKRCRSHRYVAAEEFHSTLMGVFPSELSSVFPWLNFFLGTQQAWATGWGWVELKDPKYS